MPNHGVIIETQGDYIRAAYGLGGLAWGRLKLACLDSQRDLESDLSSSSGQNTVLVIDNSLDERELKLIEEMGIAGLILGGLASPVLESKIPLVITEGFGRHKIAGGRKNNLKIGK